MPAPPDPSSASARRIRALVAGGALLAAAAALAVALRVRPPAPAPELPAEPARRPSIVLVLIDTLRPDYLGAYGFAGDVSPHLDALAGESVLFERAFAQAPWTKPSIASLFTSLHPDTHRVLSHMGRYGDAADASGASVTTDALPSAAVTLAEALREQGYATAAFVANPWLLEEHGFGQGFAVYQHPRGGWALPAPRLLRLAHRWLAGRDPNQPFFLYLHLMDVHGPYRASDADYEAVRGSPGLGPSRPLADDELARLKPYLLRAPWAAGDGARDVREWRARYAAGVHATDRELGRFLIGLEHGGLLDDAIVVVTSDHGEELADDGGWDHGHGLHDHQIHVPLLVRPPGGVAGGRRVAEVVSLVDVMPTLLARAGAPAPPAMQGRDLSPLLRGAAAPDPASASFAGAVKWHPELRSVRTSDWKLIEDERAGRSQLYDVAGDPHEQRDVAADRPRVAERLAGRLAAHRGALAAAPPLAAQAVQVPDAVLDRLEALGYAR